MEVRLENTGRKFNNEWIFRNITKSVRFIPETLLSGTVTQIRAGNPGRQHDAYATGKGRYQPKITGALVKHDRNP